MAAIAALLLGVAVVGSAANPPPRPTIGVAAAPIAFDATALPESLTPVDEAGDQPLAGAPVLANGLISVAATPQGLLLFSHDPHGRATVRARLALVGSLGDVARTLRMAKATECGRTTVAVQLLWDDAAGQTLAATVSLQRGNVTCEIAPGDGAGAIRMLGPEPAAIIVPAFYGDDFLFDPADAKGNSAFVPSEFLVLWPLSDGAALVQAVWNPPDQERPDMADTMVEVTMAERDGRKVIAATSLTFGGKSLYFAAWEMPGLWAKVAVDDSFGTMEQPRDVKPRWQAPFPAAWQAILHSSDNYTSWGMRNQREKGLIGAHGREIFYDWPFWVENGANWLRLPPAQIQGSPPDYALIYPLQRESRTPPEMKLPDDILRESLKTGVCAHLFRTGGGGNPGGPLCVLIRRFRMLAALYADTGRASDLLLAHAQWIHDQGEFQYRRLRDYQAFGERVAALVDAAGKEHPDLAEPLTAIAGEAREITDYCRQTQNSGGLIPAGFRDFRPVADDPVAALAEVLAELKARMAEKAPDNLSRWRDLADKLHHLAVHPQGALPRPRALTRVIQNRATRMAVASPTAAKIAAELRVLAQDVLRDKHWAEQER